jgi:hypothetical protein
MQATYVPPVFSVFSSEPLNLFLLVILFSGNLSLSKEESGTHLNFKNQKVEVMSLFYGFLDFYIFSRHYLLLTIYYSLILILFFTNLKPLTSNLYFSFLMTSSLYNLLTFFLVCPKTKS